MGGLISGDSAQAGSLYTLVMTDPGRHHARPAGHASAKGMQSRLMPQTHETEDQLVMGTQMLRRLPCPATGSTCTGLSLMHLEETSPRDR